MDNDEARKRLVAERAEVMRLLGYEEEAGAEDRAAEAEIGDAADPGQPLASEGEDDALAEQMRDRLDAINRALERIESGTYGYSLRSGQPIPEARLAADPAAELTVEEAAADERR